MAPLTTHPPAETADLTILQAVLDSAPTTRVDLQAHEHEHFDVFVDWLDGDEDWFAVDSAEELQARINQLLTPYQAFALEATRVLDLEPSPD